VSQISGYVKEIYEGTTKWGKPWWSITLDTDAKISTREGKFMKDVEGKDIEEGKEYTFTYEKSGDFINLTAPSVPVIQIKTAVHDDLKEENQPRQVWKDTETTSPDSTTAPQTDDPTDPKVSPFKKPEIHLDVGTSLQRQAVRSQDKDEAIRKAVALKASVEYVSSVLGGTGTTKDVISYAREFEAYLK
jgi:hypothetical protein